LRLSVALSSVLAVECILATSAGYELIEWWVALVFAPAWADQFLGLQGDIFDAQKDMALATAGAVLSISVLAAVSRWRRTPGLVDRTADASGGQSAVHGAVGREGRT
jgi:putative membrane protein